MKINIDFNNPKEVKKVIIIVLGLIIIAMIIGYLITDNEQRKEEIEEKLTVEEKFLTTETIGDKLINYNKEDQIFYVESPGYESINETEVETVVWFIENTDLDKIRVHFGGIGGETREYDLNKEPAELLKNNPLINSENSEVLLVEMGD